LHIKINFQDQPSIEMTNNIPLFIDVIGWIGASCLLIAYLLISNGKLSANTYTYQILNAFGSICLIINTYIYYTIPLVMLNSIWLLIGLNTLRKLKKTAQ